MDPRFVLFLVLIIVFIYFVPTHSSRENFTNQKIRPTWGCPAGGNLIDNKKWCSQQTTAAGPSNSCPNGYFYNQGSCTKQEYTPSNFCPAGYKFNRNKSWCIN